MPMNLRPKSAIESASARAQCPECETLNRACRDHRDASRHSIFTPTPAFYRGETEEFNLLVMIWLVLCCVLAIVLTVILKYAGVINEAWRATNLYVHIYAYAHPCTQGGEMIDAILYLLPWTIGGIPIGVLVFVIAMRIYPPVNSK